MNSRPRPSRPRPVVFPDIAARRLQTGPLVIAVPDARIPRVTVRVELGRGMVHDQAHPALLPLGLELITHGTSRHSSTEIAEALDRLAVRYRSDVRLEHSFVSATVMKDQLEDAMEILGDLLRDPSYPETEVEKVRELWRSRLAAQRSQSSFLAEERIRRAMYGDHPYARMSIRTGELDAVEPGHLRDAFPGWFSLHSARLGFAGAVDLEQACELAGRYLAAEPAGVEQRAVPAPHVQPPQLSLVDRPHSVQARLTVAGAACAWSSPDFLAARVANQILGGSASARLFMNLREKLGYTYGIYSHLWCHRQHGIYLISADVRAEKTAESIREVLGELEGMSGNTLSRQELERSRSELAGAHVRELETAGSVLGLELTRLRYDLPQDYWSRYAGALARIDAQRVLELSRTLFDPGRTVITAVGDRGPLEPQLKLLGDVAVYDTQGNRI